MDDAFIWLALACFFNWLALGVLMWRYSRFERRVHRFMTDPYTFEAALQDMEVLRALDRREHTRTMRPPDVEATTKKG